jgi:hypothetical protein
VESYAYLKICSESLTSEAISGAFGQEPSERWFKGKVAPPGYVPGYQHGSVYKADIPRGADPEVHIREALRILRSGWAGLSGLTDCTATIVCVAYYEKANLQMVIEAEIVAQIAECGAALEFDLYCIGEGGDDDDEDEEEGDPAPNLGPAVSAHLGAG